MSDDQSTPSPESNQGSENQSTPSPESNQGSENQSTTSPESNQGSENQSTTSPESYQGFDNSFFSESDFDRDFNNSSFDYELDLDTPFNPQLPSYLDQEIPDSAYTEADKNLSTESQSLDTSNISEQNEEETLFSQFLNVRFDELNKSLPPEKKLSLSSSFAKNQQSNWLFDFNQEQVALNSPQNTLFCKTNGLFYNNSELDSERALIDLGFSPEQANKLSPDFDFVFLGTTQTKSKKNPNDVGFKTYAMKLKDPDNPKALDLINAVRETKNATVDAVLNKEQSNATAIEKILQDKDRIIKEHMANTNAEKPPFIGVGDKLFLDSASVRSALAEIPELKGKFIVKPLEASDNSQDYLGKSVLLDSFYQASLNLNEIKTKNPNDLPQEKLEQIVTQHIEKNPDLVFSSTPAEAMTLRDPSVEDEKNAKLDQENKIPSSPKQVDPSNPTDPEKNQAKDSPKPNQKEKKEYDPKQEKNGQEQDQQSGNNKKKKPITEVLLNAIADVAVNSLKILLELVKRILMLLVALVLAVFNRTRPYAFGLANGAIAPITMVNRNNNPSEDNRNVANQEKSNQNAIDPEKNLFVEVHKKQEEKAQALKEALDNIDLSKELDKTNAKKLGLDSLVSEHLLSLSDEKQQELKTTAVNKVDAMNEDQKNNLLESIKAKSLHTPLQSQPIPDLMHVDDKFGILLAKNDLVKDKDGHFFGVLDANDVNGKLLYTVAKQKADGDYEVSFKTPEDLQLTKPNGVKIDNAENLINQSKDFVAKLHKDVALGSIKPVALLDRNAPDANAVNLLQYAQRNNILPLDLLKPSSLKNGFNHLIERSTEYLNARKNRPIHIHVDREPSIHPTKEKAVHPQYGALLGVNDLVQFKNDDAQAEQASVLRAYEAKGKLHYMVLADDQVKSIPADQLELMGTNKGQLTPNQINDVKLEQSELIAPLHLPQEHLKIDAKTTAINLNPTDEPLSSFTANSKTLRLDNGKPLDSNNIISVFDIKANESKFYATLGLTDSNLNKVIAIEIDQTPQGGFAPKSNASLAEINIKDNATSVHHTNVSDPDLVNAVALATENYTLAHKNSNDSLHHAIEEIESNKLKVVADPDAVTEYAVANLSALYLADKLNKELTTNPDEQLTLGASSNLMGTTFEAESLKTTLNQYADQVNQEIANDTPLAQPLNTIDNLMTNTPNQTAHEQKPLSNTMFNNANFPQQSSEITPLDGGEKYDFVAPTQSAPTEPKLEISPDAKYHDVPVDQLRLVRVVKGLDNISIDGDTARFDRFASNEHTIRNTTHFTLNAVVGDHGMNTFSDSNYAIIGDFKDAVENNHLHGLSPADTFFWSDDFKLKNPTIVVPENDPNIEKFSEKFNVIQYAPSSDVAENYKNLSLAVESHFDKEELPFKSVNMWGWNGYNVTTENDQLKYSQMLGFEKPLPMSHSASSDHDLEEINAQLIVSKQTLQEIKTKDDFDRVAPELGEVSDFAIKRIQESLQDVEKQNPHAYEYYKKLNDTYQDFEQLRQEKIDQFYPLENEEVLQKSSGSFPPPIPQNEASQKSSGSFPPPIPQNEASQKSSGGFPPPIPQNEASQQPIGNTPSSLPTIDESTLKDPEINNGRLLSEYKQQIDLSIQNEDQNAKFLQVAISYVTNGKMYPAFANDSVDEFNELQSFKATLDERVHDFNEAVSDYLIDPNSPDFLNPSNIKNFDSFNEDMNRKGSMVSMTYENLKMEFELHKQAIAYEVQTTAQGFAKFVDHEDTDLTRKLTSLVDDKLNSLGKGYDKYDSVLNEAEALKKSKDLDTYKSVSNETVINNRVVPMVSISELREQNSLKEKPKYEFNRGMDI